MIVGKTMGFEFSALCKLAHQQVGLQTDSKPVVLGSSILPWVAYTLIFDKE